MSQLSFAENTYEEKVTRFAEVILPIPVPKLFTYRIPLSLTEQAQPGQRAIVPFGKKKIITGVIKNITDTPPKEYEAKYLFELLDEAPIFSSQQFDLLAWIADYYMCTLGEVLNMAMPSGLKLSSESRIQLNPHFSQENSPYIFSQIEEVVINLLQKEQLLSYQQIAELTDTKGISVLIKELLKKQAILLIEQVQEKYKPKVQKYIKLQEKYLEASTLERLMADLDKKPKQQEVLLKYLQRVPVFNQPEKNERGIPKTDISKEEEVSSSSLNTLVKNGVFHEFDQIISRLDLEEHSTESQEIKLTPAQEASKTEIETHFQEKEVSLLHGVTGSGKTEIYLSFIKEVIDSGSQALFLLPEIAITTQMIKRVQKIFGKQVGIYHSKFSDNERVEVWNGVASGAINFVIGVRSAIFLPFNNLSLIVVDEEHDPSYKQQDPAPRYHARDAAVVLSHLHSAKVILGSATPSIESFFNTENGKYGLSQLTERYSEIQMPEIKVIDIKKAKAKKEMHDDFSQKLLQSIEDHLSRNKQVIIFQNRRGYAPYIQCETCGWIAECENCSVSLTYHMHQHELKCHYCGFRQKSPAACLNCESSEIKMKGFGTEKIEDDLHLLLPEVKIQRMDRDTTRKKYSYQQIIEAFESGETQMLIGTQMVSKGLDFKNVTLVAVVDADRMMFHPDFRAHERAFQMMLQVSGRAGRDAERGEVLIQTHQPEHPLFNYLSNYDYEQFYKLQLQERYQFAYPPYYRLIKVILKGNDAKLTYNCAFQLYHNLLPYFGSKRALTPHEPIISKIKNIFHQEIWIKLEKGHPLKEAKHSLLQTVDELRNQKDFRKVRIYFDVDPA